MRHDEPILSAIDLVRVFGDGDSQTTAVDQVSLDLFRGQFALLMGPSGSGKSTLLAMLSGLLRPTSGKVLSRDGTAMLDMWTLTDRERERYRLKYCGYIFQGYNLFPALTARQQLEIVLRWGLNTPAREAKKQSEEVLGMLGLGNKLNLLPCHLSGGEKQRVAIGRALVKSPALCFCDEPTSALDWHHGENVVTMLRMAAQERGATLLVVTHDPRLVPFADTVFHIDDGRLSEDEASHTRAHAAAS